MDFECPGDRGPLARDISVQVWQTRLSTAWDTVLVTTYPLPSDLRLRLLGAVVALGGLSVLLTIVVTVALRLPAAAITVGLLVSVALVIAGGLWVWRAPAPLVVDEDGYRVRLIRGAGVTRARWRDVQDLATAEVAGSPCVILRLRDGSQTTIPVGIVASDRDAFVRDLRRHLDAAHGYRRP